MESEKKRKNNIRRKGAFRDILSDIRGVSKREKNKMGEPRRRRFEIFRGRNGGREKEDTYAPKGKK